MPSFRGSANSSETYGKWEGGKGVSLSPFEREKILPSLLKMEGEKGGITKPGRKGVFLNYSGKWDLQRSGTEFSAEGEKNFGQKRETNGGEKVIFGKKHKIRKKVAAGGGWEGGINRGLGKLQWQTIFVPGIKNGSGPENEFCLRRRHREANGDTTIPWGSNGLCPVFRRRNCF